MVGKSSADQAAPKVVRVKSVNPPPKSVAGWSDFGIFGGVLITTALFLQTPWAVQAWDAVLDLPFIQGDAQLASLLLLWSPNLLVYYPYSAMYAVIDLVYYDSFKHKKVQPSSPRPTLKEYWNAFLVTGVNTFIVEPLMMMLWVTKAWPAMGHCAWTPDQCHTMPSLPWALLSIVVFVLTFEVGFYCTHRLVHQRPLYQWIHKTHHTFKSPAALAAKYAHPIEHVLSNLTPLVLGPALMQTHPFFQLAWTSAGIFQTCTGHSGYWLSPILPTSHSHDWHHETTSEYFGTIGLLDSLCGTAKRWFARERGELPVHIVGVDDDVQVDESWEDSDEEGVKQE